MAGDGHPQEPPQPGPHVKLTNLGRFSPGPSGPRGGGGCWGPFLRCTLLSRQPRSEAEEGYGAPAAEPCGGWCSRGRCRSIFLAAPGTDRGGRSAGRERGARGPCATGLGVPPPRSAGRTSPTAAAGAAAANTSENSRHRGPRGNPPIPRREVADPPRARPFRAQRHTIGCAVRSFAHSALRRVLAQRGRHGAEPGWSAERLPAVTCLVGLEFGGPGPSNPEGRRDPLRPAHCVALECEILC